jgi:hypothetical protein
MGRAERRRCNQEPALVVTDRLEVECPRASISSVRLLEAIPVTRILKQ